MHPPFAAPESKTTTRSARVETLPSIQEYLDELPSIEDFVHRGPLDLPLIADFVVDDFAAAAPQRSYNADWFQQEEYDADGWALAGWQDFDWTGASKLGVSSQATDEANSAWDTIGWNIPARAPQSTSRAGHAAPSPDEVAQALDGIARRIRSGELVINQLSGTPPEAAMAAALATLLRMRD